MLQVCVLMLHLIYLTENQFYFKEASRAKILIFGTVLNYLVCKTAEGVSLKCSVKHFVK